MDYTNMSALPSLDISKGVHKTMHKLAKVMDRPVHVAGQAKGDDRPLTQQVGQLTFPIWDPGACLLYSLRSWGNQQAICRTLVP